MMNKRSKGRSQTRQSDGKSKSSRKKNTGKKKKGKRKKKEDAEAAKRRQEEEAAAKKRAEMRKMEKERKKALKEKKKEEDEKRKEADIKVEAKKLVKRLNTYRKRRFRVFEENHPDNVESKRKVMMASKGKSDLKKIESLLKKIKMSTDAQLNSIVSGIQKLNLSRFGTEIIGALQENIMKLKSNDTIVTVEVCSCVNLKYPDLLPNLVEILSKFVKDTDNEDKERRSALRFLLELEFCGLLKSTRASQILVKMIEMQQEVAKSKPLGKESMRLLSFISGMCKFAGREITGGQMSSKEQSSRELVSINEDEYKETAMNSERMNQIKSLLESTCKTMIECLMDKIKALRTLEKTNEDAKFVHGTLNEARITKQEKLTAKCDKLESVMRVLFNTLNIKMPDLSEIEEEQEEVVEGGISLWDGKESSKNMGPLDGPYEDETRRAFYEDIPDIKEMVPAVLLMSKDVRKAERLAEMQKREAEKVKARSNDSSSSSCQCSTLGKRGTLDGALKQLSIRSTEKKQDVSVSSSSDLVKNITTKNSEQVMEKKKSTTTTTTDNDGDEEEEDVVKSSRTSAKIENLLDSLPFCVNADLVLNFAVDFCYLNSKTARAQLVEKLFRAPRMALELLPYYSLLVAILSKVFDDIAEPLETLLCGEFRGLQNKKDVAFNRRESKIRNARFIGELIKFRVFAPKIAFYDFCHENILIACTLLENCGRFLYRSKPTHAKCARQLEILMRLKESKVQDQNLEYLIDNAFYQCVPQTTRGIKRKERTPMYLYIRHLILNRLAPVQDRSSRKDKQRKQRALLNRVVKLIEKLNLQDEVIQNMLVKSFLSITKGKFGSIKNVCSVLRILRSHKFDFITCRVIDGLLELIRAGLDVSDFRHNQRRVGQMKFLGELCVARLVNMNLIFETLYMLIEIGHPFPAPEKADDDEVLPLRPLRQGEPRSLRSHPSVLCKADLPHDVLRIRLICVLLDTVSPVLKRSKLYKRRLDTFLIYLDRYVSFKWSLTLDVRFMIENTIEDLRPGREIPKPSLVNETEKCVEEYEKSLNYDVHNVDAERFAQDVEDTEEEEEEKDVQDMDDEEQREDIEMKVEETKEDSWQSVHVLREERTEESDPEFEKAFRAMMKSSSSTNTLSDRNFDKLSIPVSLLGERTKADRKNTTQPMRNRGGVTFKLLNRRGGKVSTKNLVIPERVSLSQYARVSRDAERKERDAFAKRILEGAERQELAGDEDASPLVKIQQPVIFRKRKY